VAGWKNQLPTNPALAVPLTVMNSRLLLHGDAAGRDCPDRFGADLSPGGLAPPLILRFKVTSPGVFVAVTVAGSRSPRSQPPVPEPPRSILQFAVPRRGVEVIFQLAALPDTNLVGDPAHRRPVGFDPCFGLDNRRDRVNGSSSLFGVSQQR